MFEQCNTTPRIQPFGCHFLINEVIGDFIIKLDYIIETAVAPTYALMYFIVDRRRATKQLVLNRTDSWIARRWMTVRNREFRFPYSFLSLYLVVYFFKILFCLDSIWPVSLNNKTMSLNF